MMVDNFKEAYMASRKQKIKDKRKQEEKEIQQVRIAVGIFVAILVIGIGAYVINTSGLLDPAPVDVSTLTDITGTPSEICDAATPAITGGENGQYTTAPEMMLEAEVDYQAIFCTTAGAIHLDLFEELTPTTVNSMVFLANNNFYNNTVFHRVIEGFMAQGGDPTATGTGGPGYQFVDETYPDVTFDRPYLLAMANSGPATNGSQFFITFGETPWLNGGHTIFGEVISGQSVVDNIQINSDAGGQPVPNVALTELQAVVIVTPDQVTQ